MPGISSTTLLATQDNGVTVASANNTLNFVGFTVVNSGPGITTITAGGGGGFMITDFSNAAASSKDLDLGGFVYKNSGAPVVGTDLTNKDYVDGLLGSFMNTDFSNVAPAANDIPMNGNRVTGAADPVNPQDYVTLNYLATISPVNSWLLAGNALAANAFLGSTTPFNTIGIWNSTERFTLNVDGINFFGGSDTLDGFVFNFNGSNQSFGSKVNNGLISASGSTGGLAHGYADGIGSSISVSGSGCHAHGSADSGSGITAGAAGSLAHGFSSTLANIQALAAASVAFGYAVSQDIVNSGIGSYLGGYTATGSLLSSGQGSFTFGDDISSDGYFSQTFGIGHLPGSYNAFVCGQYSDISGQFASGVVATDVAFVVGNGASAVSRNNALELSKDGKLKTTGAQVSTAIRLTAGATVLSNRTDKTLVCDLTGAGGAVTLPAGELGLEYEITSGGAGAAVYTITPIGGDVLDAAVAAVVSGPQKLKFLSGTWYSV